MKNKNSFAVAQKLYAMKSWRAEQTVNGAIKMTHPFPPPNINLKLWRRYIGFRIKLRPWKDTNFTW